MSFNVVENTEIVIREMRRGDVSVLIKLHSEVFRGYNATIMGALYLKNLYTLLASQSTCTSLVALEDNCIVAWIGGVGDWQDFQKALFKRTIPVAPVIFLSIPP